MKDRLLIAAMCVVCGAIPASAHHSLAAYNMGVGLVHKGQVQEASAAFREAIRLRRGFSAPHPALGLLLKASGDPAGEGEVRPAQMLDKVSRPQGSEAPRADYLSAPDSIPGSFRRFAYSAPFSRLTISRSRLPSAVLFR